MEDNEKVYAERVCTFLCMWEFFMKLLIVFDVYRIRTSRCFYTVGITIYMMHCAGKEEKY